LRLFTPIINFFRNLNDTQKFSFIGIVLGIPIIVLTIIFIISLNQDIRLTEKRYHGTHYNYLIKDLLKHTEQYRYQRMLDHRHLSHQNEELEQLSKKINNHFELIADFEKELTISTHTPSIVRQLKKRWEFVTQSEDLIELSRAYSLFQSILIEQLEIIAIDYYLNLAKDKYIYNLTNTVVKIMPRLIEQLNQIQMVCLKSFPNIKDEEKRQVIYSASSIRNLLKDLERDRKVMLSTETSYQKHISYQDPPIVDEIADFIHYVEYEFDTQTDQVGQLIDRSADVINTSFDFYERELDHLETTISEQLSRTKFFRLFIMSFQFIAFILTVYSFIGFYLSIRHSLKQMDEEREVAEDKYEKAQQKLSHIERKLSRKIMQAHEEERKRISLDLHDSVGQALYSILVRLKIAETDKTVAENVNLQEVKKTVETLMDEVRRISHVLRPEVLDDLGFIPALKSFINHFQKIYAIKVYFVYTDEEVRLNSEIETQLYRICQEALTNVAKHAKATTIHVSLDITEEHILLTIEDNGRGFPVDEHLNEQARHEIGLYSMKERAELLSGTFNITSKINEGTIIYIKIPKKLNTISD